MSDRLPGTTYDNPIWYRGYRIHLGPAYDRWSRWSFVHDEYDGPEDRRIGLCQTEQECRDEIDEQIEEAALAAGSRRAKAPKAVECEASQSGASESEGNAQKEGSNTIGEME